MTAKYYYVKTIHNHPYEEMIVERDFYSPVLLTDFGPHKFPCENTIYRIVWCKTYDEGWTEYEGKYVTFFPEGSLVQMYEVNYNDVIRNDLPPGFTY